MILLVLLKCKISVTCMACARACVFARGVGGGRDKLIHYRTGIFIGTLLSPILLVQKDGVSGRRVLLNGILSLDPIGRIL
jgi:hypothetical protein